MGPNKLHPNGWVIFSSRRQIATRLWCIGIRALGRPELTAKGWPLWHTTKGHVAPWRVHLLRGPDMYGEPLPTNNLGSGGSQW